MGYGCVFVIRTFNNSVDGTGLLTETTVDALSHIYVVSGGSS